MSGRADDSAEFETKGRSTDESVCATETALSD